MNDVVTQLAIQYKLLDVDQSAIEVDLQKRKIEGFAHSIIDDILSKVHLYSIDDHDIDKTDSIKYIHQWIERKYRFNERT